MGLETAKIVGKERYVILAGRSAKKLGKALAELHDDGIEAEAFACDISDRRAVDELASRARKRGAIAAVVNAAGMSPSMGDPRAIMEANALGTINVNEAFYEVMEAGSCVVDVASMAGHLVPRIVLPERSYKYSRTDKDRFLEKMMARVNLLPKKLRSEVSYGISKTS